MKIAKMFGQSVALVVVLFAVQSAWAATIDLKDNGYAATIGSKKVTDTYTNSDTSKLAVLTIKPTANVSTEGDITGNVQVNVVAGNASNYFQIKGAATHTGGTTVAGRLSMNKTGSYTFGTQDIEIITSATAAENGQIRLQASGMTLKSKINITGTEAGGYRTDNGANLSMYRTSAGGNGTFSGAITVANTVPAISICARAGTSKTLTFSGAVSAPQSDIYITAYTNSTVSFTGALTAKSLRAAYASGVVREGVLKLGDASTDKITLSDIELAGSNMTIGGTLQGENCVISFPTAADGSLPMRSTYMTDPEISKVVFNTDQTIDCVMSVTLTDAQAAEPGMVLMGTDKTLTLKCTKELASCSARVISSLGLTLNATSKDNVQEFLSRTNDTTGALNVQKGVFKIGAGASFPNVSSVAVGADGTLAVDTTAENPIPATTALALTTGAKVTVADGAAVVVDSVTLDGVQMAKEDLITSGIVTETGTGTFTIMNEPEPPIPDVFTKVSFRNSDGTPFVLATSGDHIQGVTTDGKYLYAVSKYQICKAYMNGRVVCATEKLGGHLGDPTIVNGVLYVPRNKGAFSLKDDEKAENYIKAYDPATLTELATYSIGGQTETDPLDAPIYGAGGMTYTNGYFYVVGGLPDGVETNYIYKYSFDATRTGSEFQLEEVITLPIFTGKGIQTAAVVGNRIWFGTDAAYDTTAYPKAKYPAATLVCNGDVTDFHRINQQNGPFGIVEAPNGQVGFVQYNGDNGGSVTIDFTGGLTADNVFDNYKVAYTADRVDVETIAAADRTVGTFALASTLVSGKTVTGTVEVVDRTLTVTNTATLGGAYAGQLGRLSLTGGTVAFTNPDGGTVLTVGNAGATGNGEIIGFGTISATANAGIAVYDRIIADGGDLDLSAFASVTEANVAGAGWYAQNGGCLKLPAVGTTSGLQNAVRSATSGLEASVLAADYESLAPFGDDLPLAVWNVESDDEVTPELTLVHSFAADPVTSEDTVYLMKEVEGTWTQVGEAIDITQGTVSATGLGKFALVKHVVITATYFYGAADVYLNQANGWFTDAARTIPSGEAPVSSGNPDRPNIYIINEDVQAHKASTMTFAGDVLQFGDASTAGNIELNNGNFTFDDCQIWGGKLALNNDGATMWRGAYTYHKGAKDITHTALYVRNAVRNNEFAGTFVSDANVTVNVTADYKEGTATSTATLSGDFSEFRGSYVFTAPANATTERPLIVSLTGETAFGAQSYPREDAIVLKGNCKLLIGADVVSTADRGIQMDLESDETVQFEVADTLDLATPIRCTGGTFAKTGAGALTVANLFVGSTAKLSVETGSLTANKVYVDGVQRSKADLVAFGILSAADADNVTIVHEPVPYKPATTLALWPIEIEEDTATIHYSAIDPADILTKGARSSSTFIDVGSAFAPYYDPSMDINVITNKTFPKKAGPGSTGSSWHFTNDDFGSRFCSATNDQFTIEGYVSFEGLPATKWWAVLASQYKNTEASNKARWHVSFAPNGDGYRFGYLPCWGVNGSSEAPAYSRDLTDDELLNLTNGWNHFAFTYVRDDGDGNGWSRFYLNGKLMIDDRRVAGTQGVGDYDSLDFGGLSSVAATADNPYGVCGAYDYIRVTDVALPPEEFLCNKKPFSTLVLAHRGGRYEAAYAALPENTVEKFEAAVAAGCKAFETDVKMTEDGVLVISHDSLLSHYFSSVPGQIEYTNSTDLLKLTIKNSSCKMPTLAQLLEVFKTVDGLQRIEFEMKVRDGSGETGILDFYRGDNLTNYCNQLYAAVSAALPAGTYAFTSFDAETIKAMKGLHPEASTGYIESQVIYRGFVDKAVSYGCDSLSPKYPTTAEQVATTIEQIAYATEKGLKVGLWMVEDYASFTNSAAMGAYEVTSDRPVTTPRAPQPPDPPVPDELTAIALWPIEETGIGLGNVGLVSAPLLEGWSVGASYEPSAEGIPASYAFDLALAEKDITNRTSRVKGTQYLKNGYHYTVPEFGARYCSHTNEEYTIEGYFQVNQFPTGGKWVMFLASQYESGANDAFRWHISLAHNNTKGVRFGYKPCWTTKGSSEDAVFSPTLTDDQKVALLTGWHHFAFTYQKDDGTEQGARSRFYVDGETMFDCYHAVGTAVAGDDAFKSLDFGGVSVANGGTYSFPGAFDYIRVSNKALEPKQFLRVPNFVLTEDTTLTELVPGARYSCTNDVTLTLSLAEDVNFTGYFDGPFKVIKEGAGALSIAQPITIVDLEVAEGSLSCGPGATLAMVTNVTIGAHATLTLDAAVSLPATIDLHLAQDGDASSRLTIGGESQTVQRVFVEGLQASKAELTKEYSGFPAGMFDKLTITEDEGPWTAGGQDGLWTSSASGNWETAANWAEGKIAGGLTRRAYFSEQEGPITVTVTDSHEIGSLVVSNANYVIGSTGSGVLSEPNTLQVLCADGSKSLEIAGAVARSNGKVTANFYLAKDANFLDEAYGCGKVIWSTPSFTCANSALEVGYGYLDFPTAASLAFAAEDASRLRTLRLGTLRYTGEGEVAIDGFTMANKDFGGANGFAVQYATATVSVNRIVTENVPSTSSLYKSGLGALMFAGTEEFTLGGGKISAFNAETARGVSPNGNSPTNGLQNLTIAEGKVIVGVAGDPNNAPVITVTNGLAVGVGGAAATAELEVNNGSLTVASGECHMGWEEAPTAIRSKLTVNGGELHLPSLMVMYEDSTRRGKVEDNAGYADIVVNDGLVDVAGDVTLGQNYCTSASPLINVAMNGGLWQVGGDMIFGEEWTSTKVAFTGNGGRLEVGGTYYLNKDKSTNNRSNTHVFNEGFTLVAASLVDARAGGTDRSIVTFNGGTWEQPFGKDAVIRDANSVTIDKKGLFVVTTNESAGAGGNVVTINQALKGTGDITVGGNGRITFGSAFGGSAWSGDLILTDAATLTLANDDFAMRTVRVENPATVVIDIPVGETNTVMALDLPIGTQAININGGALRAVSLYVGGVRQASLPVSGTGELIVVTGGRELADMPVLADRGGMYSVWQGYPTNTLEAFETAVANGCKDFITDVRWTSDKEFVITAEANLSGVSATSALIEETPVATVTNTPITKGCLDHSGACKIPTLGQLVDLFCAEQTAGRAVRRVEFRLNTSATDADLTDYVDGVYAAVAAAFDEAGIEFAFAASSTDLLAAMKASHPGAQLVYVANTALTTANITTAANAGAAILSVKPTGATKALVEQALAAGVQVCLRECVSCSQYTNSFELGAYEVVTDYPEIALEPKPVEPHEPHAVAIWRIDQSEGTESHPNVLDPENTAMALTQGTRAATKYVTAPSDMPAAYDPSLTIGNVTNVTALANNSISGSANNGYHFTIPEFGTRYCSYTNDAYTIEGFFKLKELPAASGYFFLIAGDYKTGVNNNNRWHLLLNRTDKGVVFGLQCNWATDATCRYFSPLTAEQESALTADWNHLALTYLRDDGTGQSVSRLYLNGTELTVGGEAVGMRNVPKTTEAVYTSALKPRYSVYRNLDFGGTSGVSVEHAMPGAFDYIRVSDWALVPSQFLTAKSYSPDDTKTATVAYWKLDWTDGGKLNTHPSVGDWQLNGLMPGATASDLLTASKMDFVNDEDAGTAAAASNAGCLWLHRAGAFVEQANLDTEVAMTTSFTVECWFKSFCDASGVSSWPQCIFGADKSDSGWSLRLGCSGGKYFLKAYGQMGTAEADLLLGGSGTVVFDNLPNPNAWHHLALTYDATAGNGTWTCYVDGVAGTPAVNSKSPAEGTYTGKFRIGSSGAYGFRGYVDQMRICSSVLTPSQFMNTSDRGATATGVLALWPLDTYMDDGVRFDGTNTASKAATYMLSIPRKGNKFKVTRTDAADVPTITNPDRTPGFVGDPKTVNGATEFYKSSSNGKYSYVMSTDPNVLALLNSTDSYTIECFARRNGEDIWASDQQSYLFGTYYNVKNTSLNVASLLAYQKAKGGFSSYDLILVETGSNDSHGSTSIEDGAWHHIAWQRSFDGNKTITYTLWLDGVKQNEVKQTTDKKIHKAATAFFVGGRSEISGDTRQQWRGAVSSVRVSRGILKPEEFLGAGAEKPLPADEATTIAYWPMENAAGAANTLSIVNSGSGTLQGAGATGDADQAFEICPNPDRTGARFTADPNANVGSVAVTAETALANDDLAPAVAFEQAFTIEGWVKRTSVGTGVEPIVGTLADGCGWQLYFEGTALKLTAKVADCRPVVVDGVTLIADVSSWTDRWTHFALERLPSAGQWKLFVDGVETATATDAWTGVLGAGETLTVGGFAGKLDMWRLSRGALPSALLLYADYLTLEDGNNVVQVVLPAAYIDAFSGADKAEKVLAASNTLLQVAANGQKNWVNYALGQADTTSPAIVVDQTFADKVGQQPSFSVPVNKTGFKVTYQQIVTDANGSTSTNDVPEAEKGLDIPLTGDPSGVYQVRTLVRNSVQKSNPLVSEILLDKVGVMQIAEAVMTSKNALIPVPWEQLGSDGEIAVADLVDIPASKLADGDELRIYAADGTYFAYELANGAWTPILTVTAGKTTEAPEAATVTLQRGQGVWLVRNKSETADVYLVGRSNDAQVTTELTVGFNLLASPTLTGVDLDTLFPGTASKTTSIRFPGETPRMYTKQAGSTKWSYLKLVEKEVKIGGQVQKLPAWDWCEGEAVLPRGQGFFLCNQDGWTSVTWPKDGAPAADSDGK